MRLSPLWSAASPKTFFSRSSEQHQEQVNEWSFVPELEKGSQRIYLLRHGETDWNRMGRIQGGGFDVELNEDGLRQAEATAEFFQDLPLDVVASSHLQRAKVTADLIHARHKSATRLVDEAFGEMRFGGMEGMVLKGPAVRKWQKTVFNERVKAMKADPTLPWPDGESIRDVENRTNAALEKLLSCSGQHLAIVAHGRTNKIILQDILKLTEEEYKSLHQGNTCINIIDRNSKGIYKAHLLNYNDHIKNM